jgi:hypothetical protein
MLFADDTTRDQKVKQQRRLNFESVGSKFRTQLSELLAKLKTTVSGQNAACKHGFRAHILCVVPSRTRR